MKKLKFDKTEMQTSSGEDQGSTSDLMLICLNVPPQGGFNIATMRQRIRVIEAIEQAKQVGQDEIEIEDADFETLKACVKLMKWAVLHKDIVSFCDYIDGIKDE